MLVRGRFAPGRLVWSRSLRCGGAFSGSRSGTGNPLVSPWPLALPGGLSVRGFRAVPAQKKDMRKRCGAGLKIGPALVIIGAPQPVPALVCVRFVCFPSVPVCPCCVWLMSAREWWGRSLVVCRVSADFTASICIVSGMLQSSRGATAPEGARRRGAERPLT